MSTETELKSADRLAFEHYLRTGRRLPPASTRIGSESKFNPWHDPQNGEFTNALEGSASLGGSSRAPTPRASPSPAPKSGAPKTQPPRRAALGESVRSAGWRRGGDLPPPEVEKRADHAMSQYYENRSRGMSPDEAAAWAANSEIESYGDHRSRQPGGGPGRGLYQWGSHNARYDRRIDFQQAMGVPIEQSTREQQHRFRDHELNNKEKPAKLVIDAASGAGDKAYAISMEFLRPRSKGLTATARANLAEAILRKVRLQARKRIRPKRHGNGLHLYIPTLM